MNVTGYMLQCFDDSRNSISAYVLEIKPHSSKDNLANKVTACSCFLYGVTGCL